MTPMERMLRRSPYSVVTMVARIRGEVTETMVKNAVAKLRRRHVNLRVRVREDPDHEPWFTSEGAGEIPVEAVRRESDDDWIRVQTEAGKLPFEFDVRPAVRFVLVRSPGLSEVIILCHHILCDGLSLAYLARDLMVHLGDPDREAEPLPDPVIMDRDTMPEDVPLMSIVRFFIDRMNRAWKKERVVFDEEDYRNINEAYWARFDHRVLSVELPEDQTSALVERCRKEGVTVNSALSAAFLGAQTAVLGRKPHSSILGVAVNLRDRLRKPAGEGMGFYAGMATPKYGYDSKIGFWENARRFQKKIQPLYTNRALFANFLVWCHLDPSILEAIHFKKLGGLVAPHQSRHAKLAAFGARRDVVLSVLKREGQDSLRNAVMGTAVTNLTRMDFPNRYGALELDRLILQPGGGFPLVTVPVVLGVVTCAGKLSLVVEHAEQAVESAAMRKIKDLAMGYLANP